jgi:cytosine/adenosine deaminase-related metal-dependent hydrolase
MNNQKIILVHNVETGREDLTFINDMKLKGLECWLCLCPNANLFINDKLPDLLLISRYSENIIVGTDSLASNSQLNILEELKTLHVAFPSFAIRDLLRWATVNGAKALNIEEEAGSFEKGKQPGIVLIKGLSPGSIMQDAVSSRIL